MNPRLIGVAGKGAGLAAFVLVVAACAGASDKERAIRPVAEQPSSRLVNGLQLAVAATATGNPPRPQVALLRPNGDRVRELNLPSSGSLLSIAWSPDGRRIAFTRWLTPGWRGPSETDIFVADADGSNVRRLTRSKRADDPVWSPDGETIVFSQDEGPPASQFTGLWRVDADGGEPRELIPAEPGRVDIPSSFAPDGRALAFTRFVAPEPGAGASRPVAPAVHLLELASGEDRSLAENAADAAFSPDGRRVAFVSFRDRFRERFVDELERYGYELYVMDADGGNARRLTRTREMREQAPSWSPDGRLLAYERSRITGLGSMVMTIRPDGTCPRPFAFDPGWGVWYDSPTWRPGRRASASDLRCRRAPSRAQPWPAPMGGNFTLQQARRYRALAIYWLGPQYRGALLSTMHRSRARVPRGPGPNLDLIYGDVQIQLYHVCVRVPADTALAPDGRIRLRGRDAVLFEGRTRLELVTGRTTIVVYGPRHLLPRVIEDLRPLNPRVASASRSLPPPVPGALERRVKCAS